MNIEIERKFLVNDKFLKEALPKKGIKIWQAYLVNKKNRSLRIRQKGEKAYITIKIGNNPLSRKEFEYEIPLTDLLEMKKEFKDCPSVEKIRYEYLYEGNLWEIDIFEGTNDGLVLCEIELSEKNIAFKKPEWIGEEVTHNTKYLNINLASEPFKQWLKL